MKKFKFPLRSVQTVRTIRELKAREVFSIALARHAAAVNALQEARSALAGLEELIRAFRTGHFKAAEHVAFSNEILVREACIQKAMLDEVAAARQVNDSRELWIVARRDLRIVEKLEIKAKENHRIEAEHEEQSMLDDRANAIIARIPLIAS